MYGRKETYNHVLKCVFFANVRAFVAPTGAAQRLLGIQVPARPEFKWIRTRHACSRAITTNESSILIRWWAIMTPDSAYWIGNRGMEIRNAFAAAWGRSNATQPKPAHNRASN